LRWALAALAVAAPLAGAGAEPPAPWPDTPLARLEAQIAFDAILSRVSDLRLADERLIWRENLGLRGLQSLRLHYRAT